MHETGLILQGFGFKQSVLKKLMHADNIDQIPLGRAIVYSVIIFLAISWMGSAIDARCSQKLLSSDVGVFHQGVLSMCSIKSMHLQL